MSILVCLCHDIEVNQRNVSAANLTASTMHHRMRPFIPAFSKGWLAVALANTMFPTTPNPFPGISYSIYSSPSCKISAKIPTG